MAVTVEQLNAALAAVIDPNTGKDLVSTKSAKNVRADGADVSVDIELGYPAASQIAPIRRAVIDALKSVSGVGNVSANVYQKIVAHTAQRGVKLLPNVKNIIAVASGKGGVGKSTTAVNLALALAAEGATVGMLDADIYGPSQPVMLGISGKPETLDGKSLEPMMGHGIQASSIGFMIDTDTPMVWRGHSEHIFGAGGGERMSKDYDVEYLGGLPLDIRIREQTDSGRPTVVAEPDGAIAQAYKTLARRIAVKVAERARDMSLKFPSIVVQNT